MSDMIKGQLTTVAWDMVASCWHYLAAGAIGVFLLYSLVICLFKVARKFAAETLVVCLVGAVILYLAWPEKKVYIPPTTIEETE